MKAYFTLSVHRKSMLAATAVILTILTILLVGVEAAQAQNLPPSTPRFGCMGPTYYALGGTGSNLCTASDVKLSQASYTIIDGCTDTTDTATIVLSVNAASNATRYDFGIWTSLDGQSALTGANCSVSALPYTPILDLDTTISTIGGPGGKTSYCSADSGTTIFSGPLGFPYICSEDTQCTDIDPSLTCEDGSKLYEFGPGIQDRCGDIDSANSPRSADLGQLTVKCNSTDGLLTIPTCTSWKVPGNEDLCLSAESSFPSESSKCTCEDLVLDIPVGVPQIIVDKVTNPSPDTTDTSFGFTLSGPGSVNQTFSLKDADPPHASGVLSVGTGYSVIESPIPNDWSLTSAVCTSDGGTPSGTGDDTIVPANDISLTSSETVRCVFTNTDSSLAVTISYFLAELDGDTVNFVWQTATETGNAGFNLFAETDGGLVELNDELIPSTVIDSVTPTDYSYEAVTSATTFYIEEVSIAGSTNREGPFTLGVPAGAYVEIDADPAPFTWLPMISN